MSTAAIAIVEDEQIVAEDIGEALKSMGYSVAGIMKSGETALAKICELRPDLVLMDIHLAGEMDGIEAAVRIRGVYDVPVIYLTAYADDSLIERAKLTEPFGYILKPYDERELHSAIEMALYKHRIEKEVKKRDAILFAIGFAVEQYLRVRDAGNIGDGSTTRPSDIHDMLEHVGIALDAHAIGVFRIRSATTETPVISLAYEWTGAHAARKLYHPSLKGFTFASAGITSWEQPLAMGKTIAGNSSALSEPERHFMEQFGAASLAVFPVFIGDALWGFAMYCSADERSWSADEVEALRIMTNILGATMR